MTCSALSKRKPTNAFINPTAQGEKWFQVSHLFLLSCAASLDLLSHDFQSYEHVADSAHSRQALKKFVKANNAITVTDNMFDSLFNKALKSGVEKGVFEQPKGTSLLVSG
jgi:hypothetical protein